MREGKGTARPCNCVAAGAPITTHEPFCISNATARPWKIGYGGMEGDGYATIISHDGRHSIAELGGPGYNAHDAALIVSRVNGWEALEAERDDLKSRLMDSLLRPLPSDYKELQDERDSLKRTVEELRDALKTLLYQTGGVGSLSHDQAKKEAKAALAKAAERGGGK